MIKTTRYNWYNFVPITLLIQFTKVINIFYTVNLIMQCYPQIRTVEPEYGLATLLTLIFIGMLKEFLADYKRYKTDKISNSNPVQRLTGKIDRTYRRTNSERRLTEDRKRERDDVPLDDDDMQFSGDEDEA